MFIYPNRKVCLTIDQKLEEKNILKFFDKAINNNKIIRSFLGIKYINLVLEYEKRGLKRKISSYDKLSGYVGRYTDCLCKFSITDNNTKIIFQVEIPWYCLIFILLSFILMWKDIPKNEIEGIVFLVCMTVLYGIMLYSYNKNANIIINEIKNILLTMQQNE